MYTKLDRLQRVLSLQNQGLSKNEPVESYRNYNFKCLEDICDIYCRDAWSALGDMPKEDAMIAYVEEMKKVRVARYVEESKYSTIISFLGT